jgi:3'-5' exoribonuclease
MIHMPHRPIRDLCDGESVQDTYLLLEKEMRQATQGPYLHLLLCDKTGRIQGRLWDATRKLFDAIPAEGLVQVSAHVRSYRNQLQFNVSRIAPAPTPADLSDYLPHTTHDIQALWKTLRAAFGTIKTPALRRLLDTILDDESIASRLRSVPAATTHHHAWVGGLLEHNVSLLRLAEVILPLYPGLDRDLLLAGILLHDLGKIEELAVGGGFRYTDSGKLVGHIGLGLAILERKAKEIGDVPQNILDQLRHLIASHHGQREWGALCVPATREAIALHYLDNLDAKLSAAAAILEESADLPGNWTEYVKTFDRSLYKGGEGRGSTPARTTDDPRPTGSVRL